MSIYEKKNGTGLKHKSKNRKLQPICGLVTISFVPSRSERGVPMARVAATLLALSSCDNLRSAV